MPASYEITFSESACDSPGAKARRPWIDGARKPLATRASQLTSLTSVLARYGPLTGVPNGTACSTLALKSFLSCV
ncbi:hypothetical protein WR25_27334 [Diploscapter pachys]|uniref:Uncharacterized protein n=1 Tax=Diploscapter pachys TaxID=2018661 RepID=A0A2A2M5Y6_9BILA|nr:hypothetical protein WR25_27334 [Diploscapter pachys]